MTDFATHAARAIRRLGRPVTVTPFGQPARVVNAVFTTSPDVSFGLVDGFRPALRMVSSDASGLMEGDAVVVGTDSYTVMRQPTEDRDTGDVLVQLDAA